MRSTMFILLAPIMLLIAVLFHFIPRMRKRNLYFAVTVTEEFRQSAEGQSIARTFRALVWAGTALALVASWVALGRGWVLAANLAPDVQIVVILIAWVIARRRTRSHAVPPAGVRSAEIVQASGGPTWGLLALILPPFGPVAAAVFLWLNYSELPAHWGRYTGRIRPGHVDHFIDKSPLVVFATPVIAAAALLLCLAIGLGIRYASRRGSSGERAGWAPKFRRLNLMMLTAIMWAVSLMTSVLSVAPLLSSRTIDTLLPVFSVALLATVIGFAVPLIRMSMERTGGTDATPDECWKGGMIYYNPADPALMVERDGVGFTINFGNRLSWWFLALVLVLVIGPLMLALGLK